MVVLVHACAFLSLLFEPLHHHTDSAADDLLQAVSSVTLTRENIFCTHPQISC